MLTGFANPSSVTLHSHTRAISGDDLQVAFDRAGGGEMPPPAWELYLRSGRRSDLRLRIIDVATAVEVALSRALDRRLVGQPKAVRNEITLLANGVVGLIRLLPDTWLAEAGHLVRQPVPQRPVTEVAASHNRTPRAPWP
jgi:hypothetical protein